ncbi:MAG: hypothetical protein JNK82_25650 [Myxococcaceae bacterium]|nr:hypothetical protein [Myxococcaceae bacterium]
MTHVVSRQAVAETSGTFDTFRSSDGDGGAARERVDEEHGVAGLGPRGDGELAAARAGGTGS